MDGDNMVYCEKCEKKYPAIWRQCIKKLPKTLILVLKRFDMDYEIFQKKKVNDFCEFPIELNMEPYTKEGLNKKDH